MAKAVYLQNGDTLNYTNSGESAIGYMDVIDLTSRVAIAACEIAAGATGTAALNGVYEIPADNAKSFAAGAPVYWDATAGKATDNSTKTPAGWAVEAVTTSATVKIKLGDRMVTAPFVTVTGITVTPATASVAAAATKALAAAVAPTTATIKNIVWSSSDTTKATVDSDGVVTGVAQGETTITAKTENGSFTDTCVVTVTA